MENIDSVLDWLQVIVIVGSNIAIAMACIGTTISLFLWARSEAREDRKNSENILQAIQQEMKEFHGRLERIDIEFKGNMLLLEERMRSK